MARLSCLRLAPLLVLTVTPACLDETLRPTVVDAAVDTLVPPPGADAGAHDLAGPSEDDTTSVPDGGLGWTVDATVDTTPTDTRPDLGAADLPRADASDGAAPAPSFTPESCRYPLPPELASEIDARCGLVTVPEDRAQPGGRQVTLPVAVFSPRKATGRKSDPVVYLSGGPGGPGVYSTVALMDWFAPFVAGGRDVVAIDQRGTGRATPSLNCRGEEDLFDCRDRIGQGANLAHYNTVPNADDMEDVRRALGYGPWNLLGASYGTRLALEVMRRHPAGVRSVILDGLVPPDFNHLADVPAAFARTLTEVQAACERDPTCARAYPKVMSRLLELARALDKTPYTATTATGPLTVTGDDVLWLVRKFSYSYRTLEQVPELIELLRERDADIYARFFAEEESVPEEDVSTGMHYAVRCAETAVPVAAETTAAMATIDPLIAAMSILDAVVNSLCPRWNVPSMSAEAMSPVRSDLPTLVLSGHFDPATPPAYADRVAATLTRMSKHTVTDGAHGNFYRPCAAAATAAFLDNPRTPPTWTCPTGAPKIAFVVPAHRRGLTTGQVRAGSDERAAAKARLYKLLDEEPPPPDFTRW